MTAVASHGLMGIGDVLAALRPEFPDVTISKIRFLESEGLVAPQRTSSGYRKFSHGDVERLRYVLACQRDQYLPLKVIRDHLEAIDRGLEPPTGTDGPRVPRALVSTDGLPSSDSFRPSASEVRLSRKELLESSGLDDGLPSGFGSSVHIANFRPTCRIGLLVQRIFRLGRSQRTLLILARRGLVTLHRAAFFITPQHPH